MGSILVVLLVRRIFCKLTLLLAKMERKKRKIKLSEMADNMLNANALSNYSKLFFLNSHCRRRPIDVFDDRLVTWRSVESQLSLEAKRLTCKYCDRVFHKRFGLFRHVKAVHNEVLREQAERIKTTSDHRYKKDVRDDVAEDRAADDDDALDFEDEFNETVYTKPPSLPTFDMQDWLLLEELSDFQPQVELRDVYKFYETAMSLPDKERELQRIKSRKAFGPNVMERIKVESSSHEEEDDDEDVRIAELAANAKKNFTI